MSKLRQVAIAKGRDLDGVLSLYMDFFPGAREAAATPGKTVDEIFADTMMAVLYRIYLLGVEDGMRGTVE